MTNEYPGIAPDLGWDMLPPTHGKIAILDKIWLYDTNRSNRTAMTPRLVLFSWLAPLFLAFSPLHAQDGHWEITQLPILNAFHPSINNSGGNCILALFR